MKIGEMVPANEWILLNGSSEVTIISVTNTGDRPIQVGSHFHFFETNRFLKFPRKDAFGMRLNIPSGTAVRFEPGERKQVELVRYSGTGNAYGFNALTNGNFSEMNAAVALSKVNEEAFSNE